MSLSNPVALFIQQEQTAGIPLVGFVGTNYTDPSQLQFNNATPAQIAQCQADATVFNWTPQLLPDTAGFIVAVITTAGVSVQDVVAAMCAAFIVSQGASEAQLKAIWAVISPFATHPSQIVALAAQYNFPVQ
jgi:hypothetical protein